ncbi:MAG: SGNH/GDSL hydrolase family protein [Verrucomicrobia bacterium]|nr:SGNH/GDSL hydrolase family protein [Verrucomicrobiota bacterium]MBI3869214.1 SGNH/GDSL hydrolase family protein [Verrucomicrobiota bacterium]
MNRIVTRCLCSAVALLGGLAADAAQAGPPMKELLASGRVVFIGDSITYSGQYVEYIEAALRLDNPKANIDFIDLGLPSETLSGLSEPGHAGGQFPRPDVHERLARILDKAKPKVLVLCYGMNDGIYHPFSEERFGKFKAGILDVRREAEARGVQVVHVTPPAFDPLPLKGRTLPAGLPEYRSPYAGYNDVLDRYSEWLVSQRLSGWRVLDIHGPMNRHLEQKRKKTPDYRLAGDGVHINEMGHWLIAQEFLRSLDLGVLAENADPTAAFASLPKGKQTLELVQKRQRVLKDSWLTHVGHVRPGMASGKPLDEAEKEAAELDAKLKSL